MMTHIKTLHQTLTEDLFMTLLCYAYSLQNHLLSYSEPNTGFDNTHLFRAQKKKKKKTNLIQQPFLMTEKLVALSQQRIKVNENLSSDQEEMHHGMATLENLQPQTIKPSIV